MSFVPVVDKNQVPLMPTKPSRARRWIKEGKATPFFKKGVFCVRLNVEPSGRKTQPIAVGVDPGKEKEGFSVKSAAHTYLNTQADAVNWVSDALKTKRQLRRFRRYRNCPYRSPRRNRRKGGIPPSTKARWQVKLRLCQWLAKLYPVSCFVVEDIKANKRKGKRKWNCSFSPLEIGKAWFYGELVKVAPVVTKSGWETKRLRYSMGLKKTKSKKVEDFYAHAVDAWVLANSWVGGHTKPDNTDLLCVAPLRFHRRQLRKMNPLKGGVWKPYGGTYSLGLKRGSLVKHQKYGVGYLGGVTHGKVCLHDLATGKPLCWGVKPCECRFLAYNSWRWHVGRPKN